MKILTPLRYCAFRVGQEQCDSLAGMTIHEMSFCAGHGEFVEKQVDLEEVEFVPVAVSIASELRALDSRKVA
jgi:hypothetical protein